MKKIDIPIKNNSLDALIIKDNNIFDGQTINASLINIKNKSDNNILLTKEELIYLYNLYNQNNFNAFEKCLIGNILSNRDLYQDLAYIFDCCIDEITDNPSEVVENPDKYVVLLDSINLFSYTLDNKKFRLRYISGSLSGKLPNNNPDIFSSLEIVGSFIQLSDCSKYLNLNNLKYVGYKIYIRDLTDSNSLTNLEYVGGDANFECLKSAVGLKKLSFVRGKIELNNIKDSVGLNNLKYVGHGAFFEKLKDASCLENLAYIGFYADFSSLLNSKGLSNLKIIDGTACFRSLKDASSLYNLRYIGGDAYFQKLEVATGLENLVIIENTAYFDDLKDASSLKSLQYYKEINIPNIDNSKIKKKVRIM